MVETLAICDVVVWRLSHKYDQSVKSFVSTHSWSSYIKPLCLPALIMLALITEKLQNQKLEDAENSTQDAASSVLPREDFRLHAGDAPMVRGKNIWATSITDESCFNTQIKRDRDKLVDKSKQASSVICAHCKCLESCSICVSMPGTPPTPPKKRHCRSLTTPSDSIQPTGGKWQPRGSKLWKPIPTLSLSNNNKHFRNKNLSSSNVSQDFTSAGNSVQCGMLSTFKGFGSDSGHSTPSEFLTPPHSPVPRPSSASSGFCRSEESVSSLNAFCLENSPIRNRFQILQTRSLSLEDKISRNSSAGSTSSVPATISSTPASPVYHHIPRCRSQPCVLHDRKCCLKRRRESDRPSINFTKMAEAGYHPLPRSVPKATPTDCLKRATRFHQEIGSVMSLKPIASSPLDNTDSLSKHMDRPNNMSERSHMSLLKESPGDTTDLMTVEQSSEFDDEVTKCSCRDDSNIDIFPITDLDIEQIENH